MKQYSILYEAIDDPGFPLGYFCAHIPALDLATHGLGIDGAKAAASELIEVWIETKRRNGEIDLKQAGLSEEEFSRL